MKLNIWDRIKYVFGKNFEERNVTASEVTAANDFFGMPSTASGVNVTETNAMKLSAVFACVRVLSESIASLPLKIYVRGPDGSKQIAYNHPLYRILHDMSNSNQTSFEFRETVVAHLNLRGNAYILKKFDSRGNITELIPLYPWNMNVKEKKEKPYPYDIMYNYYDDDSFKSYNREQIIHIKGLSLNGKEGLSPIGYAREAIALGLAAEQFGGQFFGNGTNPGGTLESPNALSDAAYNRLKQDFIERRQGLKNSHGLLILEEGLKYSKTVIDPKDSQFIETRKFQNNEIARIFRVPPHMIADLDRSTFSNIEHQSIDFVMHSLRPWLVRIEQAIFMQAFTEKDRQKYFAEFNVDGFLRGDFKTRQEGYAIGRQNGWLNANDIRKLENMDSIGPEGDVYLVNGNMIAIRKAMEGGNDKNDGEN